MKLKATVEIELEIDNVKNPEDFLYDLLFDGLCRNAPCDFWILNTKETEE